MTEFVYLKSAYEIKCNRKGKIRCEITGCKKTKNTRLFNGHTICCSHFDSDKYGRIKIVFEPLPVLHLPGGDTLEEQHCHAVGCEVNHGLIFRNRGLFCNTHLIALRKIRKGLSEATTNNDYYSELYWREEERKFRKYPDAIHDIWINKMRDFSNTIE